MIPNSFDVLGNIAILKFEKSEKKADKIKTAKELMEIHKNITTVVEKIGKVHGRLRTIKTSYLAGEKTKVAVYRENACVFKFNIDTTYFSPRLSNERNEVAKQVKKDEEVLVLFAGVAPFSIVVGKMAKPKSIVSVEINREASKYAEENVKLNKLNNVRIVQGDVKKVIPKLIIEKKKFNRIVMARPQLKDTFLVPSLKVIKKNGIINYYGFAKEGKTVLDEINRDCKKAKKKIKVINVKKAGDIAPYKFRWRVDFRVLN
ncbi:MAG: methyltransferase domain-containing protein [Candidatus Pacearchaeota archaeon]|jgi:tRNA (guanine37-N1)-methyltransferase